MAECVEVMEHRIDRPQTSVCYKVHGNQILTNVLVGSSLFFEFNFKLQNMFMPTDYPNSVRGGYLEYQLWDSLQGLCSYLRSALSIKSVLEGAGVGSSTASAFSSALIWICRDGIGMISTLLFAYGFAGTFEVYTKEWRLFADVLNNIALLLDLISSILPIYYMHITVLSTICKSCCWLIAGSTKARIAAHFARDGYLADVTAKESTQETAVSLFGMVLGMLLAYLIGNNMYSTWVVYLILTCIHQFANYKLVRVLVFNSFNPQRCYLITDITMCNSSSASSLLLEMISPLSISRLEKLATPLYLSAVGPQLGVSWNVILDGIFTCASATIDHRTMKDRQPSVATSVAKILEDLLCIWQGGNFVVGFDKWGRVAICLKTGASKEDILKSYFIGCYIFIHFSTKRIGNNIISYSKDTLAIKYKLLVDEVAKTSLQWYAASLCHQLPAVVPGSLSPVAAQRRQASSIDDMNETGWNVDGVLLNPGLWRFDSSSIGHVRPPVIISAKRRINKNKLI